MTINNPNVAYEAALVRAALRRVVADDADPPDFSELRARMADLMATLPEEHREFVAAAIRGALAGVPAELGDEMGMPPSGPR